MLFKTHAFTLLELMITLAIAAILLVIILPSYEHYETRAKRNRAEVALMQLAAHLESYFSDQGTYQGATPNEVDIANLEDGLDYQLEMTDLADNHFEIEAVPTGSQLTRDTHCATLSLSDTNVKKISGNGTVSQCWM